MPDYYKAYKQAGGLFVHQRAESVAVYDVCRYIAPSVIDYFIDQLLVDQPQTVLEAGVGNGRMFIPLCQKTSSSTQLIGTDISEPMLNDLRTKLNADSQHITLHQTDLRDKNFFAGNLNQIADVAYSFATLHIISEHWQDALDNIITSIKPTGKIVLGEELNSAFFYSENIFEDDDYRITELHQYFSDPAVQQDVEQTRQFFAEYQKIRQELGQPFHRVNGQILYVDQSPGERYLRLHGFQERSIQAPELHWLKPHTFREIITSVRNGTVTQFGSDLSADHRTVLADQLTEFCQQKNYDLDHILQIPAEIQIHVFER